MKRLLLPAFLTLTGVAALAGARIELPPETVTVKPGPGSELAAGQCLICHSADYLSIQPPFPRKFWQASVEKMQKKFGAPITDAQIEPLVDYLTRAYGAK